MVADCILACGMGHKAKDIFDKHNIEVVTGVTGGVDKAIELYLKDELNTENNICDH